MQHKGRQKKRTVVTIPVLPELMKILEASPTGDLTFLVTEFGRPYTAAGFANTFREWCKEAGLKDRSAHGVRKAAATYLADRGATARSSWRSSGGHLLSKLKFTLERRTASGLRGRVATCCRERMGCNSFPPWE